MGATVSARVCTPQMRLVAVCAYQDCMNISLFQTFQNVLVPLLAITVHSEFRSLFAFIFVVKISKGHVACCLSH